MNNNKTLIVLGIAAAIMVILAIAVDRGVNRPPAASQGATTYLIQGLDPSAIGRIDVSGQGNKTTLRKEGKGFVVVEKDDYPAKTSVINELITAAVDVQVESKPYSSDPQNHADLEVAADKAGTIVKFARADGNEITGLIVGKSRDRGGNFVRTTDSNDVYITPSVPWIRTAPMDYIEQQLIQTQRNDVEKVSISGPDFKYVLAQDANQNIKLIADIPAGKEFDSSSASSVTGAISSLRFEDVKKAGDNGMKFDYSCEYKMRNNIIYTLNIGKDNDNYWASATAKYIGEVPTTITQDEPQEQLKEKEAKLLARDNAGKFAAEHKGWLFKISQWQAENLTKKLDSLLKDITPPDANTPAEANEPDNEKEGV